MNISVLVSQGRNDVLTQKKTKEAEAVHLYYLDGLRALAALYVVLHHASMHFDYNFNALSLEALLYRLVNKGHYAVNLFIVLSGFCLMLPVIKNNGYIYNGIINFFKKRAKRILPAYYLTILLCVLLIATLIGEEMGTVWDASIPITNWDIIARLLLIQDMLIAGHSKINYVFWSISVEWRIYFLFPVLVFCYRKWGSIITTVLVVILSISLWAVLSPKLINLNKTGFNPHYLGLFSLGMLAAHISYSSAKEFINLRNRSFIISSLIISTLFTSMGIIVHLHFVLQDILVGINAACLLLAIASGHFQVLYHVLSWKPLAFVGTFGYSIYLLHAPLLQILYQYIVVPLNVSTLIGLLFLFLIGTPIIIGISYLFYLVAEVPFIKKAKASK